MSQLTFVRLIFVIMLGFLAAIWDARYRKIPNWLTFPAMIAGISVNEAGDIHHWSLPLLGLLTGFLLLIIPHLVGGIGAGDVKLLMALGAILGPRGVFWTTIYGAIAGGFLSFALMTRHYGLEYSWRRLCLLLQAPWNPGCRRELTLPDKGTKLYIPYGIAIGIGLVYFILNGPK